MVSFKKNNKDDGDDNWAGTTAAACLLCKLPG